jgi:hypothetical protein
VRQCALLVMRCVLLCHARCWSGPWRVDQEGDAALWCSPWQVAHKWCGSLRAQQLALLLLACMPARLCCSLPACQLGSAAPGLHASEGGTLSPGLQLRCRARHIGLLQPEVQGPAHRPAAA